MSTNETRRGVVAEFRVGSVPAADALAVVPTARLELEGTTVLDDGAAELTVWAHGVDTHLRVFERALRTADGVRDCRRITDRIGTRIPYRIETTPNDPFGRLLTDVDVLLDALCTREGWDVRALVADRRDFAACVDAWHEAGLTIDLTRLCAPSDFPIESDGELTDSQRTMLERAFEAGYFDVPRGTTLDDLGDEFDISGQSASERLRRGLTNLLAEHVATEREPSRDVRHELHEQGEPDEPDELRPQEPT